jgi:NAD(P)-dependent dehydrogenase (short-subunit alcohol dehydrogenase family)
LGFVFAGDKGSATIGVVVFVAKGLGFVAMPFRGAYNASKFAIEGLANTLRLELSNSKQFCWNCHAVMNFCLFCTQCVQTTF